MLAPPNHSERNTNVMTDKAPLSLMQWIRENLTNRPKCEKCETRVRIDDKSEGVLHFYLRHVSPCSGLESVTITAGDLAGTHA
jgi:hypothetical protein